MIQSQWASAVLKKDTSKLTFDAVWTELRQVALVDEHNVDDIIANVSLSLHLNFLTSCINGPWFVQMIQMLADGFEKINYFKF